MSSGRTRLESARRRQVSHYRYGLTATIEALVVAAKELDESPDAEAGIRRIAHELVATSSSFGHSDIAAAAARVDSATATELSTHVDDLVRVLRQAAAAGELASRILVVDDDCELAELVRVSIADDRTEVMTASTIAAARGWLASHSFDLVLLDLVLPDGDGRALLTSLKDQPLTANVPVIVLSARRATSTKTECVALGADQFLAKPVCVEHLHATIVATLGRHRQLADEARHDPLTGVLNRAGFREAFERVRALCSRESTAISIAVIDIDRFKDVNDHYGHAVGDASIVAIANQLGARLRDSDLICRWGGDEFVVGFPGATAAQAATTFEQVRAELRVVDIGDAGCLGISLSGGAVTVEASESLDDALLRADDLLYAAKSCGGDCVLTARPGDNVSPDYKILLVEDDAACASLVVRLLEHDGISVVHCDEAQAAERAALSTTFDLVILDKTLPDRDGFELLAVLRASRDYSRVPILILTGEGLDTAIERAFEMGADDYVQKPFVARRLVARVHRLIRRSLADSSSSSTRRVATRRTVP